MPDSHSALPPACPECTGNTSLKEVHMHYPSQKYILFFKCGTCAVEYPRAVDADPLEFAQSSNIRLPHEPSDTSD